MTEKPTAAFVLILITGLIVATIVAMGATALALFGLGWLGGVVMVIGGASANICYNNTCWGYTNKQWETGEG
jgi:fatty acid desaturase